MAVPQRRNLKKSKGRKRAGYTVARRRALLLDKNPIADNPSSFEDWLDEARHPGDWLENEYLQEPTMEDRLFRPPMSFLDRPRSFLDMDSDYDPDIGNDFDDLYDPRDFEGDWW